MSSHSKTHSARILRASLGLTFIGAFAVAMQGLWAEEPHQQKAISPDVREAALGSAQFLAAPSGGKGQSSGWLKDTSLGPVLPAPVRALMEKKQWAKAYEQLSTHEVSVEKTPSFAFIKGLLALWSEQPELAWPLLSAMAMDKSFVLNAEATYHAQRAAFETKRWEESLKMADRLPTSSRFYEASMLLRARALLKQDPEGKQGAVVALYRKYLKRYGRSGSATDVALGLGKMAEAQKKWSMALDAYNHILLNRPLDKEVSAAKKHITRVLKKVDGKTRRAYVATAQERTLARAGALYKRHRSEKLLATYKKQVKPVKKIATVSKSHCTMLYYIARSYSKLRKHEESTSWYARLANECKNYPDELVRALYLGGKANWNAEQRKKARAMYKRLWTEFPKHRYADDAMYFTARILREEKKDRDAQAILKKQVKTYPSGDMTKDAHWLLVRSWFKSKSYDEIVKYVDGLKHKGEGDLYSQGRLDYFAARSQELLGNKEDATQRLTSIIKAYPMGYYAMMAFERLGHLQGVQPGKAVDLCALNKGELCDREKGVASFDPVATLKPVLKEDQDIKKGVMLLRLGLDRWASRSFKRARYRYRKQPEVLWALAWMLDASGAYPFSHDIPRRAMPNWKQAYPQMENRVKWEVAYPQPFVETVEHYAERRGIPQSLIYAIMREESGFSPRIESWANARGLMQLMDKTAKRIAEVDKFEDYDAKVLFESKKNIRLGSAYLNELSSQFGAHPILIIAGYNGGYGNVSRWLKNRGTLPVDVWVEDIPYGQTRKYTKRVLTTFWAYSWLYGTVRTPSFSFKLPS